MRNRIKPIPDGYHTVTPYLTVRSVPELLEFVKRAFGAHEIHRMVAADGRIMHAEVRLGDSVVMMGEAGNEWKAMPGTIHLYVYDTDAVYQRALQAGGASLREPADQFYGDRSAGVRDPVGNHWWIATHKEDVSSEEMEKRAHAFVTQ